MLSLIVAMSESARVIGLNGTMPWRLSHDLRRFRTFTTGHAIIMGRKTYDSIGKPLPNRTNIVMSNARALTLEDCEVVGSLDEALVFTTFPQGETFVIGGESIFREALPRADRLYVTFVDYTGPGDTFFPEDPWEKFEPLKPDPMIEAHGVDEKNSHPTRFMVMQRRDPNR